MLSGRIILISRMIIMLSGRIIMLSGMIIISGMNKMLCSMIIMLRGMIILLSSMIIMWSGMTIWSRGMIIIISGMIINTLNTIKANQASPKLCEMEAQRTIALKFTGSYREWRKLFRSLGSIGIDLFAEDWSTLPASTAISRPLQTISRPL